MTTVSEYYLSNNDFPTQANSGVAQPATAIIQGITVTRDNSSKGHIDIVFNAIGGSVTAGTLLRYVGTGSQNGVSWSCTSPANTLEGRYRPATCR
jgi:type IV pilus assembly protein PilA